jgi:hypothetical protein
LPRRSRIWGSTPTPGILVAALSASSSHAQTGAPSGGEPPMSHGPRLSRIKKASRFPRSAANSPAILRTSTLPRRPFSTYQSGTALCSRRDRTGTAEHPKASHPPCGFHTPIVRRRSSNQLRAQYSVSRRGRHRPPVLPPGGRSSQASVPACFVDSPARQRLPIAIDDLYAMPTYWRRVPPRRTGRLLSLALT